MRRSFRSRLARPFYWLGDDRNPEHTCEWAITVADAIVHGIRPRPWNAPYRERKSRVVWRAMVEAYSTPYPGEGWLVCSCIVAVLAWRVFA